MQGEGIHWRKEGVAWGYYVGECRIAVVSRKESAWKCRSTVPGIDLPSFTSANAIEVLTRVEQWLDTHRRLVVRALLSGGAGLCPEEHS
jgi:hypothetical protein